MSQIQIPSSPVESHHKVRCRFLYCCSYPPLILTSLWNIFPARDFDFNFPAMFDLMTPKWYDHSPMITAKSPMVFLAIPHLFTVFSIVTPIWCWKKPMIFSSRQLHLPRRCMPSRSERSWVPGENEALTTRCNQQTKMAFIVDIADLCWLSWSMTPISRVELRDTTIVKGDYNHPYETAPGHSSVTRKFWN